MDYFQAEIYPKVQELILATTYKMNAVYTH